MEGSVRAVWAADRRDLEGSREGEGQPRMRFMSFLGFEGGGGEVDMVDLGEGSGVYRVLDSLTGNAHGLGGIDINLLDFIWTRDDVSDVVMSRKWKPTKRLPFNFELSGVRFGSGAIIIGRLHVTKHIDITGDIASLIISFQSVLLSP